MSLEDSDLVEELLDLERQAIHLSVGIADLERYRIPAIEQGLSQSWSLTFNPGCLTTLDQVKVVGGDAAAAPLLGSTVRIVGGVTGNDYGTHSAPTGILTVDIYVPTNETSLDFYVTGPGSRFATGPAINLGITPCTTNSSLPDLQATPATGYHYLGSGFAGCQYPIKDTLSFDEPIRFGVGNQIFWNTGTLQFDPYCTTGTSLSIPGCPTPVTTSIYASLVNSTGTPSLIYPTTGFNSCPSVHACGSFALSNGSMTLGLIVTQDTTQCPDNSTLFRRTLKGFINSNWYNTFTFELTFYET